MKSSDSNSQTWYCLDGEKNVENFLSIWFTTSNLLQIHVESIGVEYKIECGIANESNVKWNASIYFLVDSTSETWGQK